MSIIEEAKQPKLIPAYLDPYFPEIIGTRHFLQILRRH